MGDSEQANARRRKAAHAAFATMPRNALLDAYLTDTEQELLVNLMTEVIVDADEVVIRQGEVGNNFFLIAEGECTVSIDDVDIGRRLTAGNNCGEIGLIEQTTRTATVTAASPKVRLLLVHKQHFMKAIGDSMFEKHRLFTPFLQGSSLFGQLNAFELTTLIDRSVVIAYPPGSAVCRAADAAKFRLVFEGSIESANGMTVDAGDYFGELELLAGRPHEHLLNASATHGAICLEWGAPVFSKLIEVAFAVPHCVDAAAVRDARIAYRELLGQIESTDPGPDGLAAHRRAPRRKAESAESSDFAFLTRSSSTSGADYEDDCASVASKTDPTTLASFVRACKKVTIFESIDDALVGSFTEHMAKRVYKPGAVVFLEGDQGNQFYFVSSGNLDMYVRGDGGWMRSYTAHDTFGELALYHRCRRQGTVVARDECVLWSIDRLTFNHVLLKANMGEAKPCDRQLLPPLKGLDKLELRNALANVQDERSRLISAIAPVACDDGELRSADTDRADARPTSIGRMAKAAFLRLVGSPAKGAKGLKPLLPPITPPTTSSTPSSGLSTVSSKSSSKSDISWSQTISSTPSGGGGVSRRLKFGSEEIRVDDRSVTPVQKLVRLIRSPSAPIATSVRPHNLRPLGADELPRLAQPRLVFDAQSVLVAPALLGEGAYGTVHVVRHTATAAKQYALKQMCKKQLIASSSTHRVVLESQLLEKMNSRFVVDKVASFQTADKVFLVLDLMPGGDIYSLLAALPPGQLDYADLRAVAAHTLLALEHVHSRAVVHRDVKLENLLLAEDCTVKLCDFGLAKTVTTRTFTLCGTPEYMAPEILNSTGYGRGVDYWALGIILYELYSGCGSPFAAESHLDVYSNILHTKPKFSASFPPQVADLVGKLLEHDVGKRLGMLKNGVDDIKAHAFFEGYDWQEAPSMRDPRHAAPSPVVACGEHEWLRLDLAPEERATRKTPISREQDKLFAGF